MTGIRPYDRRPCYLYTDDIVKLVDYDGNEGIFKIARHESIAQHTVKFTSEVADGGIPPGQEVFAEFRFLQPARENRLFEIRPFLFAVKRAQETDEGRPVTAPFPWADFTAGIDYIPAGVELKWKNPTGTDRDGTDLAFDVDFSLPPPTPGPVTTPLVGGVRGGFIEAVLIPYTDDITDVFKMAVIYGHTVQLGIANRTDLLANGFTIGGDDDDKDYFIGVVGRKHILGAVDEETKKKVMEEAIDYKAVTIGGIPIVTTRA